MLTAVLFVLKTGIGRNDLPTETSGVSYKTCVRRIAAWTAQGIWQRIHQLFLGKLRGADLLDWWRVLVECSLVKAPLGGPIRVPTRRIRAAGGSRHCVLTDAGSVPLVVQTAPANQHDVTTMLPLVVNLPAVAGKRGVPKQMFKRESPVTEV